ncbi:MAG: hypothetical protein JJE47_02770 [Acidimicrobiia bacterium]|nr:hypothetical protein [Acidimicrobiia bacterium]
MKLEDLAQNAARQARNAAQEMPVVPIKEVRKHRRTVGVLVPILGVAATWMVIAVLTPPPVQTSPVATSPTATSVGNTQTSTALPNVFQTVVVTDSDLIGFDDHTDSILPLPVETVNPATDCCIVEGANGELLVLRPNRVLSVTDGTRELIAWDDMNGLAFIATSEGLAIAGTDDTGSSVLRLYAADGSLRWSMPLGVDWGEGPQLALDGDNVIWRGARNFFPEDSGFAEVQWFPIANLNGTQDVSGRRMESRPLPDGRSVGITEYFARLIGADGSGIQWELPKDLTVVSADPFLDGLLVTAVADPSSEVGRVLVAVLQPGVPPMGFWLDRVFGPFMPGPTTISTTDQALFGLGGNDESFTFISVASLETLYPLPPFTIKNVDWIAVDHQTIRSPEGTVLARGTYAFLGRPSAWDEDGGVVTFGDDGLLRWMRPGGESFPTLPSQAIAEIVEVVKKNNGYVVGARLARSVNTIIWFELESGTLTDPPTLARTLDGLTFSAGGRTATIAPPDWSNVQLGEGGEPIPPYDLPELLVTADDGTELLRVPVGTTDRPFVEIHDFDGRRLILSAVPQEPGLPPQTVWIIDLECSGCTEMMATGGPVWFDLIGTLTSTGDVVEPSLPTDPTRLWP